MPWYIFYIDYMKRRRQDLEILVSIIMERDQQYYNLEKYQQDLETLVSPPWEIQNYKHYKHYTSVSNSR